jgi:hypothetical protein
VPGGGTSHHHHSIASDISVIHHVDGRTGPKSNCEVEKKMNKQWEAERSRIEHADDARITFTIALRGEHAWEMVLEDSTSYHSINHGWATENPHEWEQTIAPMLRRLFVIGRLGLATTVPVYDSPNASSANANVAMYDPPLCSPATRAETSLSTGMEPFHRAAA